MGSDSNIFVPMPYLCDGKYGCDCPELMEKIKANKKRQKRSYTHGSITMYNRGCRCSVCKQFMKVRMRRYRAKKKAEAGEQEKNDE